jgi:hypothetical protein
MLQVECSSSGNGQLEPSVIWFGSRRLDVREVVDRWYASDRRWWKVETTEGAYIVRLDEASGSWELAAVVRD